LTIIQVRLIAVYPRGFNCHEFILDLFVHVKRGLPLINLSKNTGTNFVTLQTSISSIKWLLANVASIFSIDEIQAGLA